jgi:serine/threonine protein kinase
MLPTQSMLHGGRYLILDTVGRGGMGAVYKALDLHLSKRLVAIKEMSQSGLSSPDLQIAVVAFTHEAEILARLKHQSLPHIYEQFEDGGRRYLVMEFIEGETLEHRIEILQARGKRLPVKYVLAIARSLCNVLDYLHTQRPAIVFRDLKPANIMLNTRDELFLIDFGIARLFTPGHGKDTMALGSQGYAPPEQYRRATSPRSDIYSLGATLHHLLTSEDPAQNPFLFRPFSVGFPELERLVMSMVALDEKLRPATVSEVRKALDGLGGTRQGQKPKAAASAPAPAPVRSGPLTVYAIASASPQDQKLWMGLREQIMALIDGFPDVSIKEGVLPGEDDIQGRIDAVDAAHLVLPLLSADFLASVACMQAAMHAVDVHTAGGAKVLSVLLYPCAVEKTRLANTRTVPQEPVAHLSLYAQEQRILEVARVVRRLIVEVIMAGRESGPMHLQQWLLWQLYGNGYTGCPYFLIGPYMLKAVRPSGLAGMLLHLYDLRNEHMLHEYLIGPLNCADLPRVLQVIAPAHTDAARVQGLATRKRPPGRYAR